MYFSDYLNLLYIDGIEIDPDVPDRICNFTAPGYTNVECPILKKLILVDGLGIGK